MPAETMTRTDLEVLEQLNRDYITSVQTSDVRRFDEILAEDFVCSNPDGSLVDRDAFLAQTARPVTISNLTAHDVRAGLSRHLATTAVAVVAILLAWLLPERLTGLAGFFYAILGPVHGVLGYRLGRRRAGIAAGG